MNYLSNNISHNLTWAEAHGRLDIIGGIADYSGSQVLEMPIKSKARVGVAPRTDGFFRAFSQLATTISSQERVEFRVKSIEELKTVMARQPGSEWTAYIIGCALLLAREKGIHIQGCDFVLESNIPIGKGLSSSAAIEVATMKALGIAYDVTFKGTELPRLCQRVENEVVGAPCGLMDQLTCYFGKSGSLLPILCQPDLVQAPIPIPEGLCFVGVDSAVRHHVGGNAYQRARTAAFMGYNYIAKIHDVYIGYLANISPNEFEKKYAEYIPKSISGETFMKECSVLSDPFSHIEAGVVYYPRACASFPVYENHRVKQCIQLIQNPTNDNLKKIGQIMFEAHRGYSACGLGHPVTDQIIHTIQTAPSSNGLLGARVSGGGCGGTVTVLCQSPDVVSHLKKQLGEILNPVLFYT